VNIYANENFKCFTNNSTIVYCKTLYFPCILISRFWNIELSLHFNLAFSQCSTGIYQAFDRQTEFSRVFIFATLSYWRNSRKFDACEKYVFYGTVQLCNCLLTFMLSTMQYIQKTRTEPRFL